MLKDIGPLLLVVLVFQLMQVGFAQVQSTECPENCINRTCLNPPTHKRCTYGCIDDSFYGAQCITECPYPCVTCYRFYKQTSECYSCIDGHFITNSDKTCNQQCPTGCKTCSSYTNCTACDAYYYKDQTSNVCSMCPTNCVSCTSDSNCSVCKPGRLGNICQNCAEGKYGVNCEFNCRTRCKSCSSNNVCEECNDGFYNNNQDVTDCSLTSPPCPSTCTACESATKCTSCTAGYYNKDADRTCTNTCLPGCAACTNGTSCTACKSNLKGDMCTECVQGKYGDNCSQNCPVTCVLCSSANVCTECINGFYSIDCSQPCPNGCLSCTSDTHCTACKPNFNGSTCAKCVDGKYGVGCISDCPQMCLNNVCHRNTSDCNECPQNVIGNKCTECKIGHHGNNCELQCSAGCLNNKCDRHTAVCTDKCVSHFDGTKCDMCVDGYYGINCSQRCPANCLKCNTPDGVCILCEGNFDGDLCDKCISGKYGETCETSCSTNCKNMECIRTNGNCSHCKPNYHGATCEQICSPNCHNNSCNQYNGSCYDCKEGFSGDKCCLQNRFCDICSGNNDCQTCIDGMYGNNCNLTCSNDCSGRKCAKDNGNCIGCKGSFYGPLCDKSCATGCLTMSNAQSNCDQGNGHCIGECIDGYHGEICNITCSGYCLNKACNKVGAACKLGCVSGRQGSFCTEEKPADPGDDNLPIATIAGVCGAVAALVLVVILVMLIRRRRNAKGISRHGHDATLTSEDSHGLGTETALNIPATPSRPVKQAPEEDEEEDNDEVVDDPYYKNYNPKAEYGNIGDIRKIVSVAELEEYLKQTTEDEFREQFKVFPAGLIKAHKEARKQGNISKNRYAGVYPYDENRVKLRGLSSDFINASYIDGHNKTRAYIASLGPTNAAMDNSRTFWHMVWQDKVEKLVVLTNLVENTNMKCEQYWPKPKLTETFGSVSVTNLNEDMNAEYTVRIFSVTKGIESRTVTQVHFTAWPDKGVPDKVTSIIEFHNKIKSLKHEMGGPILVHCSAGIGRTGTYIALDILTEEGEDNGQVDIFNCVMALRQQRVNMVQTPSQYIYLHKAVAHSLTYDSKAVPASKFQEITSSTSDDDFRHKFEQLCATMEEMDSDEKESKRKSKNLSMFNRNGGDIPGSRHRPRLFKFQTMGDNDYINAVFIDGFKERNRFIAAQTPLPDTVVNFIKLILQEECDCVVNLEPEALNVKTIGHYLPPDNQSVTHGPFVLSITKLKSPDGYTLRELKVIQDGQRDAKESLVYCFQFNKWPGKANAPSDPGDFLRFIKDVKDRSSETSTGDKPIIVHCLTGTIKCRLFCAVHNAIEKVQSEDFFYSYSGCSSVIEYTSDRSGAIKCGLFCAVHNAIEKVQSEQEVSISNIMRHIKHRRRAAFPNKDQMIFCYSAVSEYLKSFDTYSNFDLRM